MYKIICLLLCAIMVLSFAACKEAAANGNESTTSALQSGEQLNASSGNDDNQDTSSGIELEEDIFDSEDVTQDTTSSSDVPDNSESTNKNDADNSSQEDVIENLPEFDGEIELPMDKFD